MLSLRQQVQEKESNEALSHIAKFDSSKTFQAIIEILNEIKGITEKKIDSIISEGTELSLKELMNDRTVEDFLKRIQNKKDIPSLFEQFMKEKENTNTDDLSEEKVLSFIEGLVTRAITEIETHIAGEPDQIFDMKEKLEKQLVTDIFLIEALYVYRDTDDTQRSNILKAMFKVTGYTEHHFRKPFKVLQLLSQSIDFSDETKTLWQEAALWLEGLYLQTHNKMPKDEQDQVKKNEEGYPTIDQQDEKFKQKYKLTKYDMALYHHELSKIFQSKLEALPQLIQEEKQLSQDELPQNQLLQDELSLDELLPHDLPVVLQTSTPEPASNILLKKPISLGQQKKEIVNETQIATPGIDIFKKQNHLQIVVTLLPDQEKKVDEICRAIDHVLKEEPKLKQKKSAQTLPVVGDEVISNDLKTCENASPADKIRRLKTCIERFQLTQNQIGLLTFVKDDIKVHFAKYVNSSSYYLFGKVHKDPANEILKSAKSAISPQDQLLRLFELKTTLEIDDSKNLLPIVDQILLTAFNFLLKNPAFELKKQC